MLSIEASESPFQSRSENPRRQLWSPKFFQWVTIKNGFSEASDCGLDRSGNRLSLDDDAYHKRACRIVLQIRPHIIEGRRISRHRLLLVVILHRRDSYYRRTEDWSFVPSQVTFDDNSVSVHTFSLQYMIEAHTDRSNRFFTSIIVHDNRAVLWILSPWQSNCCWLMRTTYLFCRLTQYIGPVRTYPRFYVEDWRWIFRDAEKWNYSIWCVDASAKCPGVELSTLHHLPSTLSSIFEPLAIFRYKRLKSLIRSDPRGGNYHSSRAFEYDGDRVAVRANIWATKLIHAQTKRSLSSTILLLTTLQVMTRCSPEVDKNRKLNDRNCLPSMQAKQNGRGYQEAEMALISIRLPQLREKTVNYDLDLSAKVDRF